MKRLVIIEGKKYRLSFYEWIAYMNQKKLISIERKLDMLLKEREDK